MVKLCITLLAMSSLGGQQVTKSPLSALGWLEGSWRCEIWGGQFEEHWSSSTGGTMIGMGRLTVKNQTQFMEFMSIEPNGDGITMYVMLDAPSKGDKKPVPFHLSRVGKDRAVFENTKNDFPSKITYSKKTGDAMLCRIEGKQNGKDAAEDFEFKRIKN